MISYLKKCGTCVLCFNIFAINISSHRHRDLYENIALLCPKLVDNWATLIEISSMHSTPSSSLALFVRAIAKQAHSANCCRHVRMTRAGWWIAMCRALIEGAWLRRQRVYICFIYRISVFAIKQKKFLTAIESEVRWKLTSRDIIKPETPRRKKWFRITPLFIKRSRRVRKNKHNANNNPSAHFRKEIDRETCKRKENIRRARRDTTVLKRRRKKSSQSVTTGATFFFFLLPPSLRLLGLRVSLLDVMGR